MDCIGYLYFYIEEGKSKFIGEFIKEEYRSNHLASLALSTYIKLCIDENIYEFETNKKQRKPFLLYLLKTYSYELADTTKYDKLKSTIYICKKAGSLTKYLYFKTPIIGEKFKTGKIATHDNYEILNSLENTIILDKVLLSFPYYLTDLNSSYTKCENTLKRIRNN